MPKPYILFFVATLYATLALSSCSSTSRATVCEMEKSYLQLLTEKKTATDTVIVTRFQYDTLALVDSIYIERETRNDTVYLTTVKVRTGYNKGATHYAFSESRKGLLERKDSTARTNKKNEQKEETNNTRQLLSKFAFLRWWDVLLLVFVGFLVYYLWKSKVLKP